MWIFPNEIFLILHLAYLSSIKTSCTILSVLGPDGSVTMSDLPRLPRTLATITEVQRVARVAPGSLLHQTTAPTRVGEYTFPAQSLFVANLSFISHDPRHIHQPATFNPDRWIDKDGR